MTNTQTNPAGIVESMNLKTILCFAGALLVFVASLFAQANLPEPVPVVGAKANVATAMFDTILNNPASLFCIIYLGVIAWLLDDFPFVNSKFVVHITAILGASTYWLFCFPSDVPKNYPHPVAVLVGIGFICGFVAGIIHKRMVAYAIDWFRTKFPTKDQKP